MTFWRFWRWPHKKSSERRNELRILIDECLPVQVRYFFGPEDDVSTVIHLGWRSLPNGDLLAASRTERVRYLSDIRFGDIDKPRHLRLASGRCRRADEPRKILDQSAGAVRDAVRAARPGEYRIMANLPRRQSRSRRR